MFFFDLEPGGSLLAYNRVTESGYEIQASDYVVSVNNGATDPFFIILPDPAGITGKVYIVKRFDQTSTGAVIIQTTAGLVQDTDNTFDAAVGLIGANDRRMFMSNGTNWEYIK